MKRRILLASIAAAAAIASCDGLPATDPSLIGSWQHTESTEITDAYVFRADGSCTHTIRPIPGIPDSGSSIDGTYLASDTTLEIEAVDPATDERLHWSYTYYVNDAIFSRAALLPVDDHDGIVGTWNHRTRSNVVAGDGTEASAQSHEVTLQVRVDGTVSLTEAILGAAPFEATGTYREIWPEVYRMTFAQPDGDTSWLTMTLVDDSALMQSFYYR